MLERTKGNDDVDGNSVIEETRYTKAEQKYARMLHCAQSLVRSLEGPLKRNNKKKLCARIPTQLENDTKPFAENQMQDAELTKQRINHF